MSRFIYANNISTTLRADFDDVATTMQVALGTGDDFPQPTGVELLELTIEDINGNIEIVHCNQRTADDLEIVARGQGGTTPQNWLTSDRVEMRPTADSLQRALQKEDDFLTGDIDAAGNEIQNVYITGNSYIQGADVQATDGGLGNNFSIPDGGADPTIGGNRVWHEGNASFTDPRFYFVPGMIVMWYSSVAPDGWHLCDGSIPTAGGDPVPDLRARFVIGYNNGDGGNPPVSPAPPGADTPLSTGGDYTRTTSANGGHNHSGNTGDFLFTKANLPAHQHRHCWAATDVSPLGVGDDGVGGGDKNKFGADKGDMGGFDYDNKYQWTDWGVDLGGYIQENKGQVPDDPDPHNHTINGVGNHTHTTDETDLMPYVILSFIVKLDPATGRMPS